MRHRGEPLLDLVIPNQRVETVEAALDSEVGQAGLVLRDEGLVGAGEEVHEEEDQQVDCLLVDVLQLQAEQGQVLVVQVLAESPTVAGRPVDVGRVVHIGCADCSQILVMLVVLALLSFSETRATVPEEWGRVTDRENHT